MTPRWPWAVALISSREDPDTLLASVQAVLAAIDRPSCVDVLVNGNSPLAQSIALHLPHVQPPLGVSVQLRLWQIALADKANAINAYLYGIAPKSQVTYFVDGYARPQPLALGLLAGALEQHPSALAASAMPTHGPSAPALRRLMLSEGGLHGNLFAVAGSAMESMQRQGFRLPVGMYRTDSTIGAALAFGLDPEHQCFDSSKYIRVVPGASWSVGLPSQSLLGSLQSFWSRRQRQAQGDLENSAIQYWLERSKRPLGSLPATVRQLVEQWCQQDPVQAAKCVRWHPLRRRALNRVMTSHAVPATTQACLANCQLNLCWRGAEPLSAEP